MMMVNEGHGRCNGAITALINTKWPCFRLSNLLLEAYEKPASAINQALTCRECPNKYKDTTLLRRLLPTIYKRQGPFKELST